MVLTDKQKISLLVLSWVACILTRLSNQSLYPGYRGLSHVPQPPRTYCNIPRKLEKDCFTNGEKNVGGNISSTALEYNERQLESSATTAKESSSYSCVERTSQLERCERATKKAYAWIYMGGCPFQIQASSICRMEWCQGGNVEACQRECKVVNDKLDLCIRRNIDSYFNWEGLNADGTAHL